MKTEKEGETFIILHLVAQNIKVYYKSIRLTTQFLNGQKQFIKGDKEMKILVTE